MISILKIKSRLYNMIYVPSRNPVVAFSFYNIHSHSLCLRNTALLPPLHTHTPQSFLPQSFRLLTVLLSAWSAPSLIYPGLIFIIQISGHPSKSGDPVRISKVTMAPLHHSNLICSYLYTYHSLNRLGLSTCLLIYCLLSLRQSRNMSIAHHSICTSYLQNITSTQQILNFIYFNNF